MKFTTASSFLARQEGLPPMPSHTIPVGVIFDASPIDTASAELQLQQALQESLIGLQPSAESTDPLWIALSRSNPELVAVAHPTFDRISGTSSVSSSSTDSVAFAADIRGGGGGGASSASSEEAEFGDTFEESFSFDISSDDGEQQPSTPPRDNNNRQLASLLFGSDQAARRDHRAARRGESSLSGTGTTNTNLSGTNSAVSQTTTTTSTTASAAAVSGVTHRRPVGTSGLTPPLKMHDDGITPDLVKNDASYVPRGGGQTPWYHEDSTDPNIDAFAQLSVDKKKPASTSSTLYDGDGESLNFDIDDDDDDALQTAIKNSLVDGNGTEEGKVDDEEEDDVDDRKPAALPVPAPAPAPAPAPVSAPTAARSHGGLTLFDFWPSTTTRTTTTTSSSATTTSAAAPSGGGGGDDDSDNESSDNSEDNDPQANDMPPQAHDVPLPPLVRPRIDLLQQLVTSWKVWKLIERMSISIGSFAVSPSTYTSGLGRIRVILFGHFPPTTFTQIQSQGNLWVNERGQLGERCWRAVIDILLDIAVRHFGMEDRTAARNTIMDRVAIFNRNPTAGHATWHTSNATQADYKNYCEQAGVGMDVFSRRLVQKILNENHLPNLDAILVFGIPGYHAIVEGGTRPFDGSWFRDPTSEVRSENRSRHLLRHQRGTALPHMLQIAVGWCSQQHVDNFLSSAVRIVATIFDIGDANMELREPYSYLRPASSSRALSQIRRMTGLVQGPTGVVSASLFDQLEAENPGFGSSVNIVTAGTFRLDLHRVKAALASARGIIRRGDNPADVWGPFSCGSCGTLGSGEGIGYGSQCTGCGYYTHINGYDILIRGYCNNCNLSGRYMADLHKCGTHSSPQPFNRTHPRAGFVISQTKLTKLLARIFDTETDEIVGTISGTPNQVTSAMLQYAETVLEEDNYQLPTRVPLFMLKQVKRNQHSRGPIRYVQPLALLRGSETRARDQCSRVTEAVRAELHYDGSGLQDGSLTIGRRRYEGVPIPRL